MLGIGLFGSYILWVGLFLSVAGVIHRKNNVEQFKNFPSKVFWSYFSAVLFLIVIGIVGTKIALTVCQENAINNGLLTCFDTRVFSNFLAPVLPWIVNCLLWHKMTAHKS